MVRWHFQTSTSNPYVGDGRYEVVPSNFHFDRFDVNQDQIITQEEFMRMEGIDGLEVGKIFNFADLNGKTFYRVLAL